MHSSSLPPEERCWLTEFFDKTDSFILGSSEYVVSGSTSKAAGGSLTHLFGHVEEIPFGFLIAHDVRIRTSSEEEGWLGPIRGRSL